MFGFDDEELARIRRGPARLRWWVVGPMYVLFALLACLAWPLDLINDPDALRARVRSSFKGDFSVDFTDFVMLPVGSWLEPASWRFALTGLSFRPGDPKKPDWSTRRITLTLPEPRRSPDGWVAHFPWLRVSGLEIHAHQQRPPPPWEPVAGVVDAITADVVEIVSASFDAPDDPPIGAAAVEGIRGVLTDLVFRPGRREVSAVGEVRIARFTTGAISVHSVHLPNTRLVRSTLTFGGTFRYGQSPGRFSGEVRTFHVRSAVDLEVSLFEASLKDVVATATGSESQVDGSLDLELRVQAGGDRPRGQAMIDGHARMRDGRIQLAKDTRFIVLDLIRIAPWVKLNVWNQVVLGDVEGGVSFTRGTATLRGFSYPAGKRTIRMDGTINPEDLYFLVRLMPREGSERRAGFGVVLSGQPGRQRVRLARSEDMLKPDPWLPVEQVEAEPEGAARRQGRRNARRGADEVAEPPPDAEAE
jgi:hypothetical protein